MMVKMTEEINLKVIILSCIFTARKERFQIMKKAHNLWNSSLSNLEANSIISDFYSSSQFYNSIL